MLSNLYAAIEFHPSLSFVTFGGTSFTPYNKTYTCWKDMHCVLQTSVKKLTD